MKYSWLLFDADGTLFDFDKSQAKALERTFAGLELEFHKEYHAIYTDVNLKMWRQREQGLIGVKEIKTKRFEIFFNEIAIKADFQKAGKDYLYFLSQGSHLLDGAEELVQELHQVFKMVLLTNGLTSVQRPRFKMSPITRYFKEVIISEEVGFSKPDKKIFDLTFKLIGYPPKEEVVIIGDNLGSDILGGLNYGIDSVWYNPGKINHTKEIKPLYEVSDFKQLRKLLFS